MRVALVEDDEKIAALIVKGLRQAGFAVDHAVDGEDGLRLAISEPYDACIVDIMLPKLDGLSLIAEMRRQKVSTPVIILSAKRSVDERIEGLQKGGDDYLVKPFSFSELLARVQALIRRSGPSLLPSRLVLADSSARSPDKGSFPRESKDRFAAARVCLAGVSDAQLRQGGFESHGHGACLELRLRPPDKRGRCSCLQAAQQDRS